jgi:hypothetical protein
MPGNGEAHESLTVERLSGRRGSYHDFYTNHLLENRPCLLSPSLVSDWNAFRDWKEVEETECDDEFQQRLSSSFDRLVDYYRDHLVPVVITKVDNEAPCVEEGEEVEQKQMSLADAIDLMRIGKLHGTERVYVKDWHLIRTERQKQSILQPPYQVPSIFADDCKHSHLAN